MDHNRAAETQAAEKYILGELSNAERDEFEEHYFSCRICADQVRETAGFVEDAAAVLRSGLAEASAERREPARPRFWSWIPNPRFAFSLAAAGLLLVVAAAQFVQIRGLRGQLATALAPQAVIGTTLQPLTRSEGNVVPIGPSVARFELIMDVDPEVRASEYSYEIRSAAGDWMAGGSVPAPPAGAGLHLLLPAARFAPGAYSLRLSPAASGSPAPAAGPQQFRFIISNPSSR